MRTVPEQTLRVMQRTTSMTRLIIRVSYRHRRAATRRVVRIARPCACLIAAATEASSTPSIVTGRAPIAPLRPVRRDPLFIGIIVGQKFPQ